MQYPMMQSPEMRREMLSVFRGYNANPRIGDGEFTDLENMTSDAYPLLASRKERSLYRFGGRVNGMVSNNGLCYINGTQLVKGDLIVDLGLTPPPAGVERQLVSMGAYILIFPDKKYFNTRNDRDFGDIEAETVIESRITVGPCTREGGYEFPAYIQEEAPRNVENGTLWLDTSTQPEALMRWSAGTQAWIRMEERYVRLAAQSIGFDFREGDSVELSGLPEGLRQLEGRVTIVRCRPDELVISGAMNFFAEFEGRVTISRKMPLMDHIIECGNRLWGCRSGRNAAGQIVNEIYASKLGDFRNWYSFEGTAADSYVMSLGGEGGFTGAIRYADSPVFFRENCLHRVFGSYPANFRLQTLSCPGIQRGSSGSAAVVDQILFYKSGAGIRAFDGTASVDVSAELGPDRFSNAVAAARGSKYYISMESSGGARQLFVFDTRRRLWHRESGSGIRGLCEAGGELYLLEGDGFLWQAEGGQGEGDFPWMAETGDLGLERPDNQYLSRLTLRMYLAPGAEMTVKVRYDLDAQWQTLGTVQGGELGSVTLPVQVRRCDHLRLRLEGRGEMRLYSITKTLETGSDFY